MLCRTCDYPLWNLPARQCPECGTPFLPSTYEFKVGFVRFGCPHCGQAYYGTDEHGHLEPREFDCVSCGRPVKMDEMVLLPSEGVEDEQTRLRDPVPWLAREKLGFFRGWIKTVFAGMGAAGKLACAMPPNSPKKQAWWFAAITLIMTALVASVPLLIFMMFTGGVSSTTMVSNVGPAMLVVLGVKVVWMLVWGLSAHVVLRMLGESHATLGRTFEYLCYTCGPCVVAMIPCLGLYLFWIGDIWWVISASVMISVGYGIRGWKAALAATVLPLLVVCGTAAAIFVGVRQTMNAISSIPPPPNPASAGAVSNALRAHGVVSAASGPIHGAVLVASGEIGAAELIAPGSASTGATVYIGDLWLDEFLALDADEQKKAADAASAALPPKVVAHRLGDIVFTYHGLDTANPSHAGLWAFVMWPDPAANDTPPQSVMVGMVNGATFSLPAASMPNMLRLQNTQRSQAGLPPLPDPATVTQGEPATSE